MNRLRLWILKAMHNTISWLVFAEGISLIGSRCTSFVLGIWVFQSTGKTSEILLISFFYEVPALVLNPLLGIMVDRYPRKRIMILADTIQALGSVLLVASIMLDVFSITVLFVVAMMQGVFASLQGLAADATVAPLVQKEQRHKVNAFKEMLFPLAGIIAPVVSGAFYFRWGLFSVIAFDFATYLLSVLILCFTRIPSTSAISRADARRECRSIDLEGFRYLKRHGRLLLFSATVGLTNFLWNGPLELVTPYLMANGMSQAALSLSMSFMSIGILIGASMLALNRMKNKNIMLYIIALMWNGVWMILFGIVRRPVLLAIALFFMMLPLPVAGALFKTELQNRVPPHLQGRVFSIVYQISGGTAPLSFLIIGPLTDHVLTPMMTVDAPELLRQVFGSGSYAGMGVMLSLAGLLVFSNSLLLMAQKTRRRGSS